jgi:starch synthase
VKILFATSEAQPLIKTGGLGDVSGSLPPALKVLRHDVRMILPAYRGTLTPAGNLKVVAELDLPGNPHTVRLLQGQLPGTRVSLYLVDSPMHFDRPGGPYGGPDGSDWPDNASRFALFSRAVCAVALGQAGLDWAPQVVHCNDWQTGLVPALLAQEHNAPATLFTIHNLAYQGLFSWHTFQSLELPYELWSMHAMEFYGQFSFIKGGLTYADWLTTVSPSYAREICTPEFGYGLEGLLQHRADRLSGILNGVDYATWDPAHDPMIRHAYTADSLDEKFANKTALQRKFGLTEDATVPLVGMVGRMVEQKGIDLVIGALDLLMQHDMQLVVLGAGEKNFEDTLKAAAQHYSALGVQVGYDEPTAHLIEAGADMFLMPSRFEPCGLNQMYSLRYGTAPVVRRTGGLGDTVVDANKHSLETGTATGFVFDDANPAALYSTVLRALELYKDQSAWRKMIRTGMRQDFSWERSAKSYLALYRQIIHDSNAADAAP